MFQNRSNQKTFNFFQTLQTHAGHSSSDTRNLLSCSSDSSLESTPCDFHSLKDRSALKRHEYTTSSDSERSLRDDDLDQMARRFRIEKRKLRKFMRLNSIKVRRTADEEEKVNRFKSRVVSLNRRSGSESGGEAKVVVF